MYGKMQESGLTEILPLICTSATGASILYFSHFEFLRVPLREWLLPDGYYLIFLLSGSSQRLESLTTVTSLSIDMAGNIPIRIS